MSIADTLLSIKQHIQAAYSAINKKGGTIPANKNLVNLSAAIETITGGGSSIDWLKKVNDNNFTAEDDRMDLSTWTAVKDYMFYGVESLTKGPTLTNATSIGSCAFYNCRKLEGLNIPKCSFIGSYGFYYAAYNASQALALNFETACSTSRYSFGFAWLSSITGKIRDIGSYAFYSLKDSAEDCVVHLEQTDGYIQDYAFSHCASMKDFYLKSRTSGISGSYAFLNLGTRRSNPASHIFTLDFSEATFTSISSSWAIGGGSSNALKYADISFSSVLATLSGSYALGCLQYCNVFFRSVPNVTVSSVFYSVVNTLLFVPYNQVHEAKVKTNWSSNASWIKGWLPEAESTILPDVDDEGYALTWYKTFTRGSSTLSEQVTEAIIGNPYYCEPASTQSYVKIKNISAYDCSVIITDENSNTYQEGDLVPIGAQLTITVNPDTSGYIPYELKINGTNILPSLTYIVVAAAGIEILCSVYDGVNNPYETT